MESVEPAYTFLQQCYPDYSSKIIETLQCATGSAGACRDGNLHTQPTEKRGCPLVCLHTCRRVQTNLADSAVTRWKGLAGYIKLHKGVYALRTADSQGDREDNCLWLARKGCCEYLHNQPRLERGPLTEKQTHDRRKGSAVVPVSLGSRAQR